MPGSAIGNASGWPDGRPANRWRINRAGFAAERRTGGPAEKAEN